MSAERPEARVQEVLPLVAETLLVFNNGLQARPRATGRRSDVDCGAVGVYAMWPLRLGSEWRLCQCVHHEVLGWCWFLEEGGEVVALDVLDDPRGLGPDGFPTALLVDCCLDATAALQAAYLTGKRLRKRIRDEEEWERIGRLARSDRPGYVASLQHVLGPRGAALINAVALAGRAPDEQLLMAAEHSRILWRFRTPWRALAVGGRSVWRAVDRVRKPTGLSILVCGPDGAGKSTLADLLPALLDGLFMRTSRTHWRPAVLPHAAHGAGKHPADPTTPHAQHPRGRLASLLVLAYHWSDFLLGGWLKQWPVRVRTGLVVVERGWWDIAVDRRRYRLDAPAGLVRALGALLPTPDLALILEASPSVLLERKAELPLVELERQTDAWRAVLPHRVRAIHLDASLAVEEIADRARENVVEFLEARTVSRLGPGWIALPPGHSRWVIPRGPRAIAAGGLAVYHPVTVRGLVGWHAARLFATAGGFRLLPRSGAPSRRVRELLARHIPRGGTVAVAQANHPGRYVALVLDDRGEPRVVAKVATDSDDALALKREAAALATLGPTLPAPLSAPSVVAVEPGVLVLDAVRWRPRPRPWRLDAEIAAAMGQFHRAGAVDGHRGPVHGDFAPWNLLRTASGWVLIDWESADAAGEPFTDLFHYLMQAHTLLHRPSAVALLRGLRDGEGWVGAAVRAYAAAAGLSPADALPGFRAYRTHRAHRVVQG